MAATLPKNNFALFGRWGSFSLNPGPFNIKEHVVITVMANCGVSIGGGDAYSIGAITVMRAYYKQSVGFLCSLIIVLDYTASGHKYDTTKIFTPQFHLNISAYEKYSKLYLSPLFALSIGSGFAWFTATLTHVVLFQGSDIWKQSSSVVKNVKMDIHAKLMKSYKQVPQWWFLVLLVGSVALSLLMCFVWKKDVQLPWWGMLFAFGLAFILTLPIGVIQATTNQQPGYDIIAQFIIGYILPGKPIANLLFKIYDRTTCRDAGCWYNQPCCSMVDAWKHREHL
ncbi:Oligopeptide transporter 3 [Capsicum annuum]|nr:Oligopeptide transporter 3 [Capsicum annuum]